MHSVCPDVPMIPVIEMKKGLQSSVDSSVGMRDVLRSAQRRANSYLCAFVAQLSLLYFVSPSIVLTSAVVTYLRDKDTDSLGVSRVSGLFQESSTQCRPATVLRFPVSTPGDASVMNEAKWLEKATKNDGAHVYPRLLAICASEKAVYLVLAGELKRKYTGSRHTCSHLCRLSHITCLGE